MQATQLSWQLMPAPSVGSKAVALVGLASGVPDLATATRILWFVPGLGGSMQWAKLFLEALQAQLPQNAMFDAVVGIDLPGFGLNQACSLPANPQAHVKALLHWWETDVSPNSSAELTLMGISLGAVLAVCVAQAVSPKQLVLLAPAFKAHPQRFSWRYKLEQAWQRLLQGPAYRSKLPYNRLALASQPCQVLPPIEDKPIVFDYLWQTQALSKQAVTSLKQGRLAMPVSMVVPGKDVICDPITMCRVFQHSPLHPDSQLLVYPELYHDVILEAAHVQMAADLARGLRCN